MDKKLYTPPLSHAARTMRKSFPKDFCAAPFTQLFVYPTGDVSVCCEGVGHLGNIKDTTLDDLWNGPKARKLREEFLSGKPTECARNIECKRCHERGDEFLPALVPQIVQLAPPIMLDLIVDGTCNIDCIMCVVKDERNNLLTYSGFHSEIIEKVMPRARKISIKSGEPFVQKSTFELISQVSVVNPKCEWSFTTNGQYVFNDRIKTALNQIIVEKITFSVDAIDSELFKEIRRRGTLERLNEAFQQMKKWAETKKQPIPIEFSINVTLQKKNCKEVPEVLRFYREKGISVSIIYVEHPLEFSPTSFSALEAQELLRYYIGLSSEYDADLPALSLAIQPMIQESQNSGDVLVRKLGLMLQKRVSDYNTSKRNICPYPFTQMALFPDGGYRPCCWLDDYPLQAEKNEPLSTTWNGPAIRRLREEHLSGNPKICAKKISEVGCHKTHANLLPLADLSVVQKKPVIRLDWFFSGTCNLECKSCSNWQFTKEPDNADHNWECLKREVLPYLQEIDMKGGEPFIQKRNFTLMETMAQINPSCVWEMTTNGQYQLSDRIKTYLDQLLIGYISVSIDSLEPNLFSHLRVKGELQKTLTFLDDLIVYNQSRPMGRRFEINVNFVFQKENWRETEKIIRFTQQKGVGLYLLPLVAPREFSVHDLPENELVEIRALLDNLLNQYDIKTLKELRKVIH